jgi:hypothetical protein
MPGEIASDQAGGIRVTARPVWLELCAFVTYFFTMILVFLGAAEISKWIWPNKLGTSQFTTVLLFVAWISAAGKLEIFGKRQAVSLERRYRLAAEFLFYFVGFSFFLIVLDKGHGDTIREIDVVSACVQGLLYATFLLWVVPRFPSERQNPFPTNRNFS